MNLDELENRITRLEQRLKLTEDELAIRNLIVRYGMAVDCGDVESAINCHTQDALYIVSSPTAGRDELESNDLHLHGHSAIADMLKSNMHQSLIPNCAHTVGPATVFIDNNIAKATGYSRLYHRTDDNFNLMRLAVNEWTLVCQDAKWLIKSRESRLLGEKEAQQLLKTAAF